MIKKTTKPVTQHFLSSSSLRKRLIAGVVLINLVFTGMIWYTLHHDNRVQGVPSADTTRSIAQTQDVKVFLDWFLLTGVFLTISSLAVWALFRQWKRNREAEQAVFRSEQRFRLFVENANDIIFTMSLSGIITYISPNCEEVLGYSSDEIVGRSFEALIHRNDIVGCRSIMRAIIETGSKQSGVSYRFRHKSGGWRWHITNGSLLSDPASGDLAFFGIARDDTGRKVAEETLRVLNEELEGRVSDRTAKLESSNQILNSLIENMSDWIWEVDGDGRYTYCSPQVEEVLGFSPEEMLGKTPFNFMPPEEVERLQPSFTQIWHARSRIKDMENWCSSRDGRRVLLVTNGVPILDGDGELVGYRGIDRDITEQRMIEQQLNHSRKLESVGRLAGGVAHDFNSKLSVIMGYSELVREELPDTTNIDEYMQEVSRAAEYSRDITAKLLAFSRQQIASPRTVDANQIIRDSLKSVAIFFDEKIRFAFTPAPALWTISIDPVQVDQIIMNLALNARDAMPDGGIVTFETSNCTLAGGTTNSPGDYVLIIVSDNGTGMDQETINHIFEPFFTTKAVGQGTGLGLATIHGIVSHNNGFIKVESSIGGGTIFSINLPRYMAQSIGEPAGMGELALGAAESNPDIKGNQITWLES